MQIESDRILIGVARAKRTRIGSEHYYLLFNGYSFIELQEKFGAEFATKLMSQFSAENLSELADAIEILARQGELARRAAGLESREFLKRENLEYALTPMHKTDVLDAIHIGFERDIVDKNKEIDLILLEQEKKS